MDSNCIFLLSYLPNYHFGESALCFQFSSFKGLKRDVASKQMFEKKKIKKKEDNKKLTRTDIPAFGSKCRYVNARKLAAGIRPSNR